MQYDTLLRILDKLRDEAPKSLASRYLPDPSDIERINQARARAFMHLYLKVMFGISEFNERERTITDNSYDGGIDGYYIDTERRIIYLLQSKFRTNQKNFENKQIALEELLSMDINRVLEGEKYDENGNSYNGKIQQLQREVSELPDVARYSYQVVILANLTGIAPTKIRQLTGGYPADIFDFEKTYTRLVFPVLTGTYFAASDIVIPVDLSNKNAGSKISYNVKTKYSDCEITVLFVPTLEIAKIMSKYKNTILKYNPRSYLDLEGQAVNGSIERTILDSETNEFALFNNGITMLSEETNINEKIGQKNKAQLRVKNPQIINGGQTSFTLSRIYTNNIDRAEEVFREKEVLLKIITLLDNSSQSDKLELIDEISNATNKQTPVIGADRFANEVFHTEMQHRVFERYGLLYERKRGEFSDGIKDGYIGYSDVVERNTFWRLYYAANGKINRGFQKRHFQRNDFRDVLPIQEVALDRFFLGTHVFRRLKTEMKPYNRIEKDVYGKIYAYIQMFIDEGLSVDVAKIDGNLALLEQKWTQFLALQRDKSGPGRRAYIDKASGQPMATFSEIKYYRSHKFESDLILFFDSARCA